MKDITSNVICPFYQKDAQNAIYCESLDDALKSDARVFHRVDTKKDWFGKYCKNDYKACIFAEKLFEKY